MPGPEPAIERIVSSAFRIPTDAPEADGTIAWDHTTIVVAHVLAANRQGLGYSYAAPEAARLINTLLADLLHGKNAFDVPQLWETMVAAVRNLGRPGVVATAISAVDTALWDLKGQLLDTSLISLLGAARQDVAIYGSGGFTTYTEARLCAQLAEWVENEGCRFVKMKVGSEAEHDLGRVAAARRAIGDAELFVDANGAYSRKQALRFADEFAALGVTWFEEPVSSDDLEGLHLLRDRAPAPVEIAAGEYGYDPWYFRRMLEAEAVDVLQLDATRCGGITGFLRGAALADAFMIPVSSHTAPALHLHACCAAPRVRHVEWFHDHVRIERMLFDGAPRPSRGRVRPDRTRPGHGLEFKATEAERYLC